MRERMNNPSDEEINRAFELYEVTKDGFVFNKSRMRMVKSRVSNVGYERVSLYIDGRSKDFSVHRLVAIRWIRNLKFKRCVNHKDGNKLNNDVDNLEWVSYSENANHAIKAGLMKICGENNKGSKLTKRQVLRIRKSKERGCDLALEMGVSRAMISRIRHGKAWRYD